jgi:hypothetical protein
VSQLCAAGHGSVSGVGLLFEQRAKPLLEEVDSIERTPKGIGKDQIKITPPLLPAPDARDPDVLDEPEAPAL